MKRNHDGLLWITTPVIALVLLGLWHAYIEVFDISRFILIHTYLLSLFYFFDSYLFSLFKRVVISFTVKLNTMESDPFSGSGESDRAVSSRTSSKRTSIREK